MARLELLLLGGFQARVTPGDGVVLPTRKAQALLAYPVLPAGRLHQREELAALLWGDVPDSQARRSLRKALSWLRKALENTEALTVDGDAIRLNSAAISTDVGEFERRIADGSPTALAEAVEL